MCALPGFEVCAGKDLSPSPENLVHNAGLLFQLFAGLRLQSRQTPVSSGIDQKQVSAARA